MGLVVAAAAVALTAGLAGAIQIATSGAFGRQVGVFEAAAFSGTVAVVLLWAVLLLARHGVGGIAGAVAVPPWMWAGGVMSAVLVTGVTYAAPRIGTLATQGLLIVGQLGLGVAIDAFGWFGADRIGLTPLRAGGVALVAVGAFVLLRSR